jgi:tripartite-type tricarboxylate transporter receptor subunit TctC
MVLSDVPRSALISLLPIGHAVGLQPQAGDWSNSCSESWLIRLIASHRKFAMKLARHRFIQLAAGAAAMLAISGVAGAQNYPTRPVRLVVGVSAGITPDTTARLIGQWLSERLGQQFIVDNRPGAGSNIGTDAVVRAAPDGYTLLLVTAANAINTTLYQNLNFNFIRDIAPVASVMRVPLVLEVHPSVPATNVPEFLAYAKSNPGKINLASGGNGSAQHVAGELFKMMAALDMIHVPYRGGNPIPDLLGGQVQAYFGPLPTSLGYIRTNKLRALAVTSNMRSEALPDIPTVSEFVPGYEASAFYGVGAPKNTPAEIVDTLNREINAALVDPTFKTRLAVLGGETLMGSPADFGKLIADETEKWAAVVKFSGARAD